MEETTVKQIGVDFIEIPLPEYRCDKCGAIFLNRSEDFQYCPYCGRKIVNDKEQTK